MSNTSRSVDRPIELVWGKKTALIMLGLLTLLFAMLFGYRLLPSGGTLRQVWEFGSFYLGVCLLTSLLYCGFFLATVLQKRLKRLRSTSGDALDRANVKLWVDSFPFSLSKPSTWDIPDADELNAIFGVMAEGPNPGTLQERREKIEDIKVALSKLTLSQQIYAARKAGFLNETSVPL